MIHYTFNSGEQNELNGSCPVQSGEGAAKCCRAKCARVESTTRYLTDTGR